jgi:DNA excision repair protein ERCC-4
MDKLLQYETQIYEDMFNNDALLITAAGLGIERIFLNFLKLYSTPTHLVLIVNAYEADEQFFIEKLKEMAAAAKNKPADNEDDDFAGEEICVPTKMTAETHSQADRTQAYLRGGCFFVTSRILVVDMLTDRIPIDLITGILVYNAHQVIDSSQETFILRMFREKNKAFIIPYTL